MNIINLSINSIKKHNMIKKYTNNIINDTYNDIFYNIKFNKVEELT